MAVETKVRITISLSDSGCLPLLLSTRIAELESASPRTEEERVMRASLLRQLRNVQDATNRARQRAVGRPD